jgi:hypothetical protein
MLQPCDPDTTIVLLRHALSRRPEDVISTPSSASSPSWLPICRPGHTSRDGCKGCWPPRSCASRKQRRSTAVPDSLNEAVGSLEVRFDRFRSGGAFNAETARN